MAEPSSIPVCGHVPSAMGSETSRKKSLKCSVSALTCPSTRQLFLCCTAHSWQTCSSAGSSLTGAALNSFRCSAPASLPACSHVLGTTSPELPGMRQDQAEPGRSTPHPGRIAPCLGLKIDHEVFEEDRARVDDCLRQDTAPAELAPKL